MRWLCCSHSTTEFSKTSTHLKVGRELAQVHDAALIRIEARALHAVAPHVRCRGACSHTRCVSFAVLLLLLDE